MAFCQRNYPQPLGSGPGTIHDYGCYLTCYAQCLASYGENVDPLSLNQTMINNSRFIDGDLLSDHAIDGLFPGGEHTFQVWDFSNQPAHLDMINDADPTTRFIFEVDFDHNPSDGIQTHFVSEESWDGTNLIIVDPWYGTVDNFALHYGTDYPTTILKVVGISGPAVGGTTSSPAPAPTPDPAPVPATPPSPAPDPTPPQSADAPTPAPSADATTPAPTDPGSSENLPSNEPNDPNQVSPENDIQNQIPHDANATPTIAPSQPQNSGMDKLKSRKLWATVAAYLTVVIGALAHYFSSGQAASVIGVTTAIYLAVQGQIDKELAKNG